jgi:hypothetical protein
MLMRDVIDTKQGCNHFTESLSVSQLHQPKIDSNASDDVGILPRIWCDLNHCINLGLNLSYIK